MHAIQLSASWKLRILAVLAIGLACLFTGAECKRSACWRYGHVCWGGHGKRSGQPPLFPPTGSNEAGDGSDLPSSQWNILESDRAWRPYPNQASPVSVPNKPQRIMRQPVGVAENYNGKGKISSMALLKQLTKQPSRLAFIPNSDFFEQNEGIRSPQMEYDYLNSNDDTFAVPGSTSSKLASHENRPYPHGPFATVLKRSPLEERQGNANGGGTEEPLETSSNGLDSGSVATFFRDRKSSGKQTKAKDSERERYPSRPGGNKERMDFLRREQFHNVYDILPLSQSQYRSASSMPTKTKAYF